MQFSTLIERGCMINKNNMGRTLLAVALSSLMSVDAVWANPPHGNNQGYDVRSDRGNDQPQYRQDGPQGRDNHGHDKRQPDGRDGRRQDGPHGHYYQGWAGVPQDRARRYAREEGLHGYAPLPPGMRRHMMRGHALPPGFAMREVPPQLLRRLPPPRSGYRWHVAGSDLILVAVGSAIVADILVNVLD
jgi:Ni/Co efflux regulator RcnB